MTSTIPLRTSLPSAAPASAATSAASLRSAPDRRPATGDAPSFDEVFESESGVRGTARRDPQVRDGVSGRPAHDRGDSRLDDAGQPAMADDPGGDEEMTGSSERPKASEPTSDEAMLHAASAFAATDAPVALVSSAPNPSADGDADAALHVSAAVEIDSQTSSQTTSETVSATDVLTTDPVPMSDPALGDTGSEPLDGAAPVDGRPAFKDATTDAATDLPADAGLLLDAVVPPADPAAGIESSTAPTLAAAAPAAPAAGAVASATITDPSAPALESPSVDSTTETPSTAERPVSATSKPAISATDQRPATPLAPLEGSAQPGGATANATHTSASSHPAASPSSGLAAEQLRNTDMMRRSDLARLGATTRLGVDITTDELGSVRVEALERSGALHLTLSSDDGATRQLLTDRSRELRESLGDDLASFDVDHGRGEHHARRDPSDRSGRVPSSVTPIAPVQSAAPSIIAASAVTTIDGPLDLRL